jgi:hypothetical protein
VGRIFGENPRIDKVYRRTFAPFLHAFTLSSLHDAVWPARTLFPRARHLPKALARLGRRSVAIHRGGLSVKIVTSWHFSPVSAGSLPMYDEAAILAIAPGLSRETGDFPGPIVAQEQYGRRCGCREIAEIAETE